MRQSVSRRNPLFGEPHPKPQKNETTKRAFRQNEVPASLGGGRETPGVEMGGGEMEMACRKQAIRAGSAG
jgi:hypothetical protein